MEEKRTYCYFCKPVFNSLMKILSWYRARPAFSFSASAKSLISKISEFSSLFMKDGETMIRTGFYPEELADLVEILVVFSRPENLSDEKDYFEEQKQLLAVRESGAAADKEKI